MPKQVSITTEGALGRITLDRPAAINALSRGMIEDIATALDTFGADPRIGAVLFTGSGPKGFCAGGDVRAVREMEGNAADAYFAAEYRLNARIAAFPKPLVALVHGVVMGGGLGIAGHCHYRFARADVRFAMPESAIGFFADVGVNAILARGGVHRALLFALSGTSVGAGDGVALGLIDRIVSAERFAALPALIAGAAGADDPAAAFDALLLVPDEAPDAPFCQQADLLADAPTTPADFVAAVAERPELADFDALLKTRCPASLTASFYAHLAARRHADVAATLAMDLRLARLMVRRPDFSEGVRAVLVDKDHRPRWMPPSLAALDPEPFLAAIDLDRP